MKSLFALVCRGLLALGLIGAWQGAVAQEEDSALADVSAATDEPVADEAAPAETEAEAVEEPIDLPAAPAENPPVVEEPVGEPEEEETPMPVKPPKPLPAYRGSEMRGAFSGSSSRYGVSGRVNKLAAKPSEQKSPEAWRYYLDFGIGTSSGNSDSLRYNGSASASKDTGDNDYFLKASGRYGESENEKDTDNATAEAKWQRRLTERAYTAAEGNVYRDPIADLDYRARGSVSLGRHFVYTGRTVLNVEAGPGYVAEKKGGDAEGFMAARVAQYLEFMVTPSLQIWQTVEYVPSLEDSRIFFVNGEVGLETALVANLGLRFVVENRYDNSPAEDKESNDLLTSTALRWNF